MGNLKSASALMAPALMGSAFTLGTAGGRKGYGSPMLAAALMTLLSELMFRTVKSRLPE